MSTFRLSLSLLALVFASTPSHAQPIVAQARQHVEKHPDARRLIGLAEILRAHGDKNAAFDTMRRIAPTDPLAGDVQALICWRMLPAAPAHRDALRAEIAKLKSLQPKHAWIPIWEHYLGESSPHVAHDPGTFPLNVAEKAHLDLLQELGWSRLQAGMEVIAARSYEPLHALRDLDRTLTREAGFLENAARAADANQVRAVRDRYRNAYLHAARHVVEKLFALHLLGQAKERDALLVQAKALSYLHERARLANLLERLDDEQAWTLLIEPLLKSELTLVADPPDLARLKPRTVAEVMIQSRKKTVQGKTTHYAGDVRVRLDGREISCDQLTVLHNDEPSAVIVTGNDKVELRGIPNYLGVRADRFTYHAGAFSLSGEVRLRTLSQTVKLRACSLTTQGEVQGAKSWLNDFKNAFDVTAKLELLPNIAKTYDDAELPDEAKFLLALQTLRPHLTWQAPYLPPHPRRDRLKELEELRKHDSGSTWQGALAGEPWMLGDVPVAAKDAFRDAIIAWYKPFSDDPKYKGVKAPDLPTPTPADYFWRLRDPRHADVARAVRLLRGIASDEFRSRARRWVREIERNNTALTFDIAGAAVRGRAHSVLMDVRNAEQVSFKLYRVRKPDELLFATQQIGNDFLYRDHGLDRRGEFKLAQMLMERMVKDSHGKRSTNDTAAPVPAWTAAQLVQQWHAKPAELEALPWDDFDRRSRRSWRDEQHGWYDEPDARYFDDECSEYRERIDKEYRPHGDATLSSWQCDRIVQIPGKALAEAGAYVLVAEANGQTAHVPILVDPLSLTLRRCRDGVFVVVGEADGHKPITGASVHARGQIGAAVTDKEGVAFARVFAAGDRAIVAHHDGRYAIGGFGQLFEGIYDAPDDYDHAYHGHDRKERARKMLERTAQDGALYADRHVVVAYTDRPTYRPGQAVQFKLIVRKQIADQAPVANGAFRAAEFDATTKMVMPNLDQPIAYDVLDTKGHAIATGTLKLNEFGTAAGSFSLNAETMVGTYSMRVRIAGQPRLVPDVFAVKHYRRPNFEVLVTGVPVQPIKPHTLKLGIASAYYFGPPVAGGNYEVRVSRAGTSKAIMRTEDRLDAKGKADVTLRLPANLAGGKYVVACSITDDSGRTVSQSTPLEIASPAGSKGTGGLAALPRFAAAGVELKVATTKNIYALSRSDNLKGTLRFTAKDGIATLSFAHPGWYHLRAGDEERRRDGDDDETSSIFVYGGDRHPLEFYRFLHDGDHDREPHRWVNLSDFTWEEDGHHARWEKPSHHLFALFDRQHANVGDKLRFLIYVPPCQHAKLLFTIEGRTVLDYVVMWTPEKLASTSRDRQGAGSYQIVELPMKDRYFPNVYLQGRILALEGERTASQEKSGRGKPGVAKQMLELAHDGDFDPRWCRIDVADPERKSERAGLDVRIDTDRPTYRPGDAVQASIHVTDRAGKPQSAELSLAAIDESVFAFGEDGLDRLPSFFRAPYDVRRFQPKAWRVSVGQKWDRRVKDQAQALSSLMKAADLQMAQESMKHADEMVALERTEQHVTAVPLPRLGGEMPIGNVPAARLREHFQETATWVPQVRTDAAGHAKVAFTLPDSLTRYRLTAVALTKTTELGVGRASISAGLPLAVQLFLPRFAVEKDRLQAVAVIHNTTGAPRECRIEFDVQGQIAEHPVPMPKDWKLVGAGEKFVGTGVVTVPAGGTVKVGLWLRVDRLGAARIAFKASEGKDADGEVRTLPIEPLGRAAEFVANEPLAAIPGARGKFNQEKRIVLPAGFLARDLHITLAGSEMAQALDGLDYLVDYPNGCIEQTISRFLPAVVIKHATQQTPIMLQPEIAAKLPDILQKGLLRVYNHQHADGAWGWYTTDERNHAMTVYVVYGLARCQATGTRVDAQVLRRGCQYLLQELNANRIDPDTAGRAWYALALAGHAERMELDVYARKALAQGPSPSACCNLALASRAAGLPEMGERLWARASRWDPLDTESLSLKLNAQVACGASYAECRTTAAGLLSLRLGTRWPHTRDTSWAIEALANMLGYVPEQRSVRHLHVTLAGKTILDIRDPADLKKPIHRLRLAGAQVPNQEAIEMRIQAASDETIQAAVRATGVQRMDEIKSTGKAVRLERVVQSMEGESIAGPLKIGQVFRVRLHLHLDARAEYLLLEERRPACCEYADDRATGAAARRASHQEFRDDRMCLFFTSLGPGTYEFVYYLRAETAGESTMLPGCAYPMYNEKQRGETGANKIVINPVTE